MIRLKQLRESKLLTQRELSSTSGVALTTICRLEKGHQKPHGKTIRLLATALEVAPEQLTWAEAHMVAFGLAQRLPSLGEANPSSLKGLWKKDAGAEDMVDAFLADRRQQALEEAEELTTR